MVFLPLIPTTEDQRRAAAHRARQDPWILQGQKEVGPSKGNSDLRNKKIWIGHQRPRPTNIVEAILVDNIETIHKQL